MFQACTCDQRFNLTQVPNRYCCVFGPLRKCAYFPFPVLPHCGSLSLSALSAPRDWLKNKTARIHSPYFTNLVAEPMEPIHAELLRLATAGSSEMSSANRVQRVTRPLCTSSGPQHDRRLNHREAGRHLPQQFGGSRLDYGDFALRMEGYASVLSLVDMVVRC